MTSVNHISLTELQQIIKDSVFIAHPSSYWISAEISEFKVNTSGHAYLELIEKSENKGSIKSRVRAIIWASKYRILKPFFESATGQELKEGLRILLKCTVEYHEVFGLSLLVSDIDPAFTIGEVAMKRREIISQLDQEGVTMMNKELVFPLLPSRVAVITSKSAAGYRDFTDQLSGNRFGYCFTTELFESVMQGEGTEAGILTALDNIALRAEEFDIVAVVRGGGSTSDLAWFDNYNIAFYVTQFPLPVITGIGHDIDVSVTDLVAYKNLKTPTAVAEFLINSVYNTAVYINELSENIIKKANSYLNSEDETLRKLSEQMVLSSEKLLMRFKHETGRLVIRINKSYNRNIENKRNLPLMLRGSLKDRADKAIYANLHRVSGVGRRVEKSQEIIFERWHSKLLLVTGTLKCINPENVLKRGYSITMFNGKPIKDINTLSNGESIETILSGGTLTSTITGKKAKEKRNGKEE